MSEAGTWTANPEHTITDLRALRSHFHAVASLAEDKVQRELDHHSRTFIMAAPFLCLGTQDREGRADVSPRGDPPGFVSILDDRTIAIPDRPGNNRLDSFVNILDNPAVGVLFIIPGFDDTLRINGRASISKDPALLSRMAVKDRAPKVCIVVEVDEVFMHCAKAFRRSHLWDPTHFRDRDDMASLSAIILNQTTGRQIEGDAIRDIDLELEREYKRTMY